MKERVRHGHWLVPIERIGRAISLAALTVFVLFPMAWMVSTSLKPLEEATRVPPTWIPHQATVRGYEEMWSIKPFGWYFFNSLVTSVGTAVLGTLVGTLGGYALSRFRFRGRFILGFLFLAAQTVPGLIVIGPYFKTIVWLGLFNTRTALVIAFTSFTMPFCLWMMKSFFDTIPKELDDAARVDGGSRWQVLLRVAFPLAAPAAVASAIYGFLWAWGDLLYALTLTSEERLFTVTVGLANSVGEFRIHWPILMAGAVLASLPSILAYSFLQKYLVAGLTAGAIKQ